MTARLFLAAGAMITVLWMGGLASLVYFLV